MTVDLSLSGRRRSTQGISQQAFSLQNVADKSVLSVDGVLAQVMGNVKRLIETLPQEGLLRNKVWKDLEPLVQEELNKYGVPGKAIVNGDSQAAPTCVITRSRVPKAVLTTGSVKVKHQPVPKSVEMALNSKVNGVTVEKLFAMNQKVNTKNGCSFPRSTRRCSKLQARACAGDHSRRHDKGHC